MTLTKDWSETDARVDWNGKKLQGLASAAFANFRDPATGRTLAAAAAPVAHATTLAQWRAAMVRAAPPVCSDSPSAKETTLGGEPALAWTATCSDGYDVNKLAALHGRRGYMILLASQTANDAAAGSAHLRVDTPILPLHALLNRDDAGLGGLADRLERKAPRSPHPLPHTCERPRLRVRVPVLRTTSATPDAPHLDSSASPTSDTQTHARLLAESAPSCKHELCRFDSKRT